MTKKLATDILNVLKYNSDLPDAAKLLAIESRLNALVQDVETACELTQQRAKDNAIAITDFSSTIISTLLPPPAKPFNQDAQ